MTGIAQDAKAGLLRYSWPCNVRELSNAIESAITFGRSGRIRLQDLSQNVRRNQPETVSLAVSGAAKVASKAAPVRQLAGLSPKSSTRPNASSSKGLSSRRPQQNLCRRTSADIAQEASTVSGGRRARRSTYLSTRPIVCTPRVGRSGILVSRTVPACLDPFAQV